MPSISLTLPVAGTIITAGLHATNYTALQTLLNGGLDNNNIAPGAAIASSKLAGGMLLGVRVLTASATYTPTSGTNRVYVECVAGGGGGGGAAATGAGQYSQGGGGGGGAYSASFLTSGFSGAAYTVGAAGAAGAAGSNSGGAGGDTIFGASVIVAKAGTGGAGGNLAAINGANGGNPGGGGVLAGAVGDLKLAGGSGYGGFNVGGIPILAAGGQAPVVGGGAISNFGGTAAGSPAASFGGGGAGGSAGASQAAQAGGAGGAGLIRIWEFV